MNNNKRKSISLFVPIIAVAVIIFTMVIALYVYTSDNSKADKEYYVEINRLQDSINNGTYNGLEGMDYIISVDKLSENADEAELQHFYRTTGKSYSIIMCNDGIYRVTYDSHNDSGYSLNFNIIVVFLMIIFLIVVFFYLYIYFKILRPFNKMSELPVELARGNMTAKIPESRNHYFGRFIWGINMLSDTLRDEKQRELKLEKEKKTMILSISHDLKTPLSAVKLYAKAMEQGLYNSPDKMKDTAVAIGLKTEEIQNKINEIAEASSEEFMNFTVQNSEFYLSDLLDKIAEGYTERLDISKTNFEIERSENCLLYGDFDRSFEVVQNIVENAIKYGDGRYINIRSTYEEDCCLISIENSGNNLAKEEALHIFDCFYRGSNVKDKQGNGLGLYICRKLMHIMKGDIYAETEDSFIVTLVFRKI